MRGQRIGRRALGSFAGAVIGLGLWPAGSVSTEAAPTSADGPGLARRALQGDASAAGDLEAAVEPLFDRKDVMALDEPSGSREASRLLGLPEKNVRWFVVPGGGALRLLTVDLGAAASGGGTAANTGAGANGDVA